jgi:RNA polymerase sigma-54 factor
MMAGLGDVDRLIASRLIEETDEQGYMRGDLFEMARTMGVAVSEIECVLKVCHGFEPTGVMARNLQECMALQLKERDRFDPAMQKLLDNLELAARRDLRRLAEVCGVDQDDVIDMLAEIRTLTPRPGAAFAGEAAPTVTPDVFVREMPNGTFSVELNADTLPRVLIDRTYYQEVSRISKTDADKQFLAEAHASANWLVKSLDQRARTILKVAGEIVRQQDGFFVQGVRALRPLNLKTVADAVEMHESTVSRVTSNKYMATPRGVFELKYFFTASIPSVQGGESHSAEAVRHRIKEMIDQEGREAVLSDDQIVERLRAFGIDIARRTVAKYRESMRIPSSVERRRMTGGG